MGVLSIWFLLLATTTALGVRALPWARARVAVVTLANLAFLASFASEPWSLVPLFGFLLQAWLGIVWLRARPGRWLLSAWLVWTIGLFVLLKQYAFVRPLFTISEPLVTVGLSYVLFRVLHLMIDLGSGGRIEGLTSLRFFNYTCSFLTFVSGPIQRFDDHLRETERPPAEREPLNGDLVLDAGARALIGLMKSLLAAPAALAVHDSAAEALESAHAPLAFLPGSVQLSIATLSYLLFLYWNFSGYMDLVIAAGKLAGSAVPENFSKPFSSPNFIDLWSRWHITLSDWFRFYLFNPIVTALTRFRSDARLAPYYGVVGFLITFFVMGVWHGTTGIFVFYGLLLGTATATNKLYQVQMRAWLGKQRYRRLADNAIYERACNGLAIGFFALALACFWLEWPDLVTLAKSVGAGGLLGAFALSSGVTLVFRLVGDGTRLAVGRSFFGRMLASRTFRQAWTSLALVIVVVHAVLGQSDAPAFVYGEF